jgi:hypothetical protein
MIYKVIAFCMVGGALCFLSIGILDCTMKEKARAKPVAEAMPDADRERFDPILKKHGLQYDVASIHDWPSAPYYIDKQGRRIKFK